MAAVPVNMMHGLPIPTPMQVMPCSSMLSIPISTMSYNTTNNTVTDFTQPPVQQDSTTNHVNSSSPSRSLPSASPPALGMVNGSAATTMMASASSPLPEENPEYLKELQAEKDTLELSVTTQNGTTTTGETNESNENQNKTNHALKLLEQGKQKSISVFGPMIYERKYCGLLSNHFIKCAPAVLGRAVLDHLHHRRSRSNGESRKKLGMWEMHTFSLSLKNGSSRKKK